jgi:peptidyl-prolyl cis-trans isomerase D
VPAPTDDQLKAFFEERKSAFRTPEYRAAHVLAVSPATLVKPDAVSDADARQRYEQIKGGRFGTAERRTIEQISFPSAAGAQAASERIKAGSTFEAVAAERNIDPKNLELGTFEKTEMIDPAVAETAFGLAQGAVSEPVQGRFGPVLVRVTAIEPERTRPYEEVATEIKTEMAQERARNQIEEVHDAVEDLRASARPLPEIARERGLPVLTIPAIARSGLDKAGQPVADLPEREAVLAAIFNSDVGVDNEALRTRDGGYVWFDVSGIEPARDKTLDEVREDVAAQWRADQIARRLAAKASEVVGRVEKGESLETVAGELGLQARTATELARSAPKDDLPADVVNRIFALPVGKVGSAAPDDTSRVVFTPTAATMPPLVTSTQEAARVEEQLRLFLSDDLLTQYIAHLQKEFGVTINEQNLRRAIGGDS